MAGIRTATRKLWQTLSAIKTGVILLILVVIISAVGTVILQRPVTEPDEMQRAYSPQMLHLLDTLGLTDVFHAWWFLLLMALVSLSIIAASIQRFPNAWRFYARPYKSTDENFRKVLPVQAEIAIENEQAGLSAAERVLRRAHYSPEHIVGENRFSLFSERNRISEMAVYIVHASLLLIFLGGIVDGLFGWNGFLMLTRGQQASSVEQRNGVVRQLPFAIRCDSAGQENYTDGTPKKWWSQLAVVRDGKDVVRKEIVVNDPLVFQGIRFYQASYGPTGKVDRLVLDAIPASGAPTQISLSPDETVQLDPDTTVRLAEFIPDYVVRDGQVYNRSMEVSNPAVHLVVVRTGAASNFWLPAIPGVEENASSPYQFQAKDLKMGYFTGLQVSHEPGQWAVWAGVVLMGLGLGVVFYFVHTRIWIVPVENARGQLVLWVGGAVNKNRDVFEERFRKLVADIQTELNTKNESCAKAQDASMARA